MSLHKLFCSLFVLFNVHFWVLASIGEARKLHDPLNNNSVSTVLIFGDSTVDSGNNNYINTPFRSNFPPYGSDFDNRSPTGRFTDGRLVTDYIASYAGIKEFVPPYLDPNLSTQDLLTGVCFASAGSGFDPLTAQMLGVVSLQKQLEYFKEYKAKLVAAIGKERTETLISKAVYLISAATNDVVINYLGTPFRRANYTITAYQDFVLQNIEQFIQGLRDEGAQVIGFVGMPPIGCLPIVITLATGGAFGQRGCIDPLSSIALDYNQKLQNKLNSLQRPNSTIHYIDIYQPLNDIIQKPAQFGFENVNAGCCGSGLVETSFLCNQGLPVCQNASNYAFFDSFHPSQAAYEVIFQAIRPTIDRVFNNTP